MERLEPMETLEKDYYTDEAWNNAHLDSDDDMSSDDELQQQLRKLAGIKKDCGSKQQQKTTGRIRRRSEFEDDMEGELDRSISQYANQHMGGNTGQNDQIEDMPALESSGDEMDDNARNVVASTSSKVKEITKSPLKSILKKKDEPVKKENNEEEEKMEEDEEDENPIKKSAKKSANDASKEVEFYDADEDDDNERWVEKHRQKMKGKGMTEEETNKQKGSRPRIDDGSDAVLSCPGCMSLLTRDCQRHEIYSDQYRAMFVSNCKVDEEEKLTIEKTGKEKRRQRQKLKKQGVDIKDLPVEEDDIFIPVRCSVCSTKVAVLDNDEVYHFFNVLSGYA